MLEGINVLYMESIDQYSRGALIFAGVMILTLIIGLVLVMKEQFIGVIAAICSVVVIIFIGSFGDTEPTGRYTYECIIDQSVPLNDVYERYEVIDRRGDIWVLKDKEAMNES